MNDNNEPAQNKRTVTELMEEKLNNAKIRLKSASEKCHLSQALQKLTVEEVIAHLLSSRLTWTFLESRELDFLLSLAEGAKTEENAKDVEEFVAGVKSLTKEELDMAWRYILFFLDCVKTMIA